jgi:RNA polymerase sigma-70 factor (ECF subfamily)
MELVGTRDWREGAAVSREGSEDSAFSAFVERNLRFAFRVAYALLRNRADADDVVQECFLRLHRRRVWVGRKAAIPSLTGGIRDEHAYLARVIWRLAQDRQRSPAREENGTEMDTMAAADLSPETAALASHGIARVHRMIDALPAELRHPLVLATLEELTSAQIAVILAIPEGTVRTRIQRARLLLRQKLDLAMEDRHGR